MAIANLSLTVALPDVRPDDVHDLHEAADLLPFGHGDLADRLRNFADRCARMLLTATITSEPR
jgi:hypothetical protein